jgi:hypothetical protein
VSCLRLHNIKTKKKFYVVKTLWKHVRQGGRFEFTANKLFKFQDVIARFHEGATEWTKNIYCAQTEDYDYFVHTDYTLGKHAYAGSWWDKEMLLIDYREFTHKTLK